MNLAVLMSLAGLGASLTVGLEAKSPFIAGRLSQTKQFELNLTWESFAPDGVAREQFLINGQFPGPPLIMDEGDDVEVTVNNFSPFNTTIHYHGIEQEGTPWSDGVPGVSQRQILPGQRFISKFTVQQYGAYWYHSHTSGQIMDGLYGPIYIRPRTIPANLASAITNDTFEQAQIHNAIRAPSLVMLSDWFHMTSEELQEVAMSANIDPLCTDSILINGKGRVNCRSPKELTDMVPDSVKSVLQGMEYTVKGCLPLTNTYAQTTSGHNLSAVPASMFYECHATEAAEEVIEVDPFNGWASLNFIGSASVSTPIVSINNHSLWVYEVDGLYIKPVKVDALTINNGGRYSCLVQLNKAPGKYPMTVANAGFNQKIAGFGTLSYTHTHGRSVVSTPSINYGGIATSTDVVTLDETVIEMFTPSQPSEHSDKTYILTAGRIEKAWEWSLNGNHSYGLTLEAEKPVLWDPQSAAKSPLAIATKNNTWVDIIFILSGNTSTLQPGHPLHKHSNRAYILGSGTGDFNYTSVADAVKAIPDSFNLINPPMRDTFTTLPAYQGKSWMAIRYHVQNPGAFLLHCHLDPHLTGGMGLAILDGIDAWPTIPSQYGPNGKWGSIDA
ncbi:hypothetical protein DTO013E5_7654 [Penicillium roqueforti]|nr:hypothetical protein CBS147337_9150 [Penicillium roqueforti]KAI2670355.1 hypothetical protein CBS147355_9266 [Penicillium roqueforti]KAI2695957.1 hypothetical protein CBS147372_8834 [Penicillium roqueforti]KAI2708830.1 hypothetical protein CBS147318_9344 [Penicillium roqueforti]KAI2726683.1 hypothetical protein CBS147354_4398 [Penicillium roqueforti]